MNSDLFGYTPPLTPFKDIRNQRDSVAEEKAVLCARLNAMLRRAPRSIASASVQATRNWQAAHKTAKKVLEDKRASVQQLASAINSMERFE
ncbi:hypothetical protein GCM10007320_08910 [Pseudorhodoferax aquiterrae]|uniref:Uncharacterized protein n=1 Tax=Pseudorhodoferax aquiterrae TaxID=747304 RepID=A0ABQ3FXZ9_9BURK|nr:hypothetical protein [Pseudorhodoferax aquiterrae]GHC72794.1 hypothetical protein GCM10007320_08910 [Pseudorhodoferax aquiterrae]